MNKQSIFTLTAILLCFVILLSMGLHYTSQPSVDETVKKFTSMGYSYSGAPTGKINAHSFKNGDDNVYIVWYKSSETAKNALSMASKFKANGVMRGNAVAIGTEKALAIFMSI